MENKITKIQKFEMMLDAEGIKGNEMLEEFIKSEIAMINNKADKARERAAKKKAEGDLLKDYVAEIFAGATEPKSVNEVVEAVNAAYEVEDLTNAKVVARLSALVREGKLEKAIANDDKRKITVYMPVVAEVEADTVEDEADTTEDEA